MFSRRSSPNWITFLHGMMGRTSGRGRKTPEETHGGSRDSAPWRSLSSDRRILDSHWRLLLWQAGKSHTLLWISCHNQGQNERNAHSRGAIRESPQASVDDTAPPVMPIALPAPCIRNTAQIVPNRKARVNIMIIKDNLQITILRYRLGGKFAWSFIYGSSV